MASWQQLVQGWLLQSLESYRNDWAQKYKQNNCANMCGPSLVH